MSILNNVDVLSSIKKGKKKIFINKGTKVTPLARENAIRHGIIIMEDNMRKPLIAGNWKMNRTNTEAVNMIQNLKKEVSGIDDVEIIVAPPYTALTVVAELIKNTNIELAAQNIHYEKSGAYTGEVSAEMLLDSGCTWVIIGHSERRQFFGCTDELVNKKLKFTLDSGLRPIVCIGESLDERESGETFNVLNRQMTEGLKGLNEEQQKNLTLAYEPVWAIGTGMTATPEQAEETHKFIRNKLSELYGTQVAESTRILYGGSIKPENAKELMSQENVDGGLVGGASLEADSFAGIVRYNR